MALISKWKLETGVRNWTVDVCVYRHRTEIYNAVLDLGMPKSFMTKTYRAVFIPIDLLSVISDLPVRTDFVGQIYFAMDSVTPVDIVHEMTHLSIYLFRRMGKIFDVDFGCSAAGVKTEDIFCETTARLVSLFMMGWRRNIEND